MDAAERRRSYRVEVGANASLWQGGTFCGDYAVNDLSLGGCCLCDGPQCETDQELELALQLPSSSGQVRIAARIVRREGSTLGVRFTSRHAAVEDCVQQLLLRSREQSTSRGERTLVVHTRPEQIAELLTVLEGHGHRVHVVCTPLEMVWTLESHAHEFHTAIVSPTLSRTHNVDVTAFLARRYPQLRCAVLETDERGRDQLCRGQADLAHDSDAWASRLKSITKVSPNQIAKKKRAQDGPASS